MGGLPRPGSPVRGGRPAVRTTSDRGSRASRSTVLGPAVLAALLLTACLPTVGRAQVVRGYVVDDSTESALPDVLVSVIDPDGGDVLGRATTDSTGWFLFTLRDSATVELEGSRLGWRTVRSRPLHVPPGDTVSVELWMNIRALPLAPLVVTARSDLGRSRFRRHMEEWGKGVFFTPGMIDSIAPMHPVDVLRGQEETWLSWTQGKRQAIPNIRTYLGQGCVKFMLNRLEVVDWGMDEIGSNDLVGAAAFEDSVLEHLQGREIVAVEYYRYIGEVPPDLRRYAFDDDPASGRMCGLVVYWTAEGW